MRDKIKETILAVLDQKRRNGDVLPFATSRSQQYKMAGNSIVVACMEGIFYNLFSTEEVAQTTLF